MKGLGIYFCWLGWGRELYRRWQSGGRIYVYTQKTHLTCENIWDKGIGWVGGNEEVS